MLFLVGAGIAVGNSFINPTMNGLVPRAVNKYLFFSSRRRHTRSLCDWSSDVCSSDLLGGQVLENPKSKEDGAQVQLSVDHRFARAGHMRSEERRVGKESRSRWSPYH